MHRTQIYIDEDLFELIKSRARRKKLTISEYIRRTLRKNIKSELELKKSGIGIDRFAGMWKSE